MILFLETPRMTRCQKPVRHTSVTFGTSLDCASQDSRWFSQRRMEAKPACRSTAGLDCLEAQPAELFKHTARVYHFQCGEPDPELTIYRPDGAAVACISLVDMLE